MTTASPIDGSDSSEVRDAHEAARLQLLKIAADDERSCHALLTEIAKITSATLKVERVGVWRSVDYGQALRCYHLYQHSGEHVFAGCILRADDFPTYFAALQSQRAIPADDARENPLTRELEAAYLQPLGITSMLDAPIYSNGQVAGVVCHESVSPQPRHWTAADYAFAAAVADTISRLLAEVKRKQAEDTNQRYDAHLMRVQRMEAMGRAAANIAHDFRNVLMAIRGFGELILSDAQIGHAIRGYAQRIVDTSERGQSLTQDLLTFTRAQPATPRVQDVHQIIRTMRGMLEVLTKDKVRLRFQLTASASRVLIDASQLERAMLNLIVNACDAMPHGGDLTISLHDAEASRDNNVRYVVLRVNDTGLGMNEAVRARIFEPFFTTKGEHGNGLGLAIVDQIVTHAGGYIEVDSAPGSGTTFSLFLPRIGHSQSIAHA